MKALLVYDSVLGHTEKIAQSIAAALTPGVEVKVLRVGEAAPSELEAITLLIVGSPTMGGSPTVAIQEFLAKIPAGALKDVDVIAFDTRLKTAWAKIFGYAAQRIAASLKNEGGHLMAPPQGFVVLGSKGPLEEGETERAAGWIKGLMQGKK